MGKFRSVLAGFVLVMGLAQCASTTGDSAYAPTVTRSDNVAFPASMDGGAMLNALRTQNGRHALRPNRALMRAAQMHAQDMGTNNFMDHRGSNGSKVRQRASRHGYRACNIAENLGLGQGSASEVMNQWMNSPAHRKNMLHGQMKEYGLARGPRNAWVLVFGAPGCG
ncbi:CAP domain-containing protein [Roseovarius sp. 2305UL8-3]|uniref:CAP domain-containing protein n=1 Tax=Roseovarius conchicola TaxID=3121636 RepID=UPI003527A6EB